MSLRDIKLKSCYESYEDDLVKEFYVPALSQSIKYKRIAGFFSSTSISLASRGFRELIENGGTVDLIVSPRLSKNDLKIIEETDKNPQKYIEEKIISDIDQIIDKDNYYALGWMLANKHLDIRIIVIQENGRFLTADEIEEKKIMHQKIGILEDDQGDKISFSGSVNESASGWLNNSEEFKVFRSWHSDIKREYMDPDIKKFEEMWNGSRKYLESFKPLDVIDKLIEIAPSDKSEINALKTYKKRSDSGSESDKIEFKIDWSHQDAAVEKFIREKHGILEMATGTGKTRTALRISSKLFEDGEVNSIIITAYGTSLLKQWVKEILSYNPLAAYKVWQDFDTYKELEIYLDNPTKRIIVVSLNPTKLDNIIRRLSKEQLRKTLLIVDEAHKFGSPKNVEVLSGKLNCFKYRLGLSATPDREYDDRGKEFVANELGRVIFEFGIEEAIEKGILCEFNYIQLDYYLTDDENREVHSIRKRYYAMERESGYLDEEGMSMAIAKVRKGAVNKISSFERFLVKRSDILRRTFLFVVSKAFGELVQDVLLKHQIKYRTFYAEEENQSLIEFGEGGLDVLISCTRLNEGIDVRSCKNIVLFSADSKKLTSIQRIGRALRRDPEDPSKIANIVDFIDEGYLSDVKRSAWISECSKARRNRNG